MGIKETAAKLGKRLGWELILFAVWALLTIAGFGTYYFIGRGVVIAAQDTYFKYVHGYLSPDWPKVGFGWLIGCIPAGIIIGVRWFNRRNVPVTTQTLSVEAMGKASATLSEATKKLSEIAVQIGEDTSKNYTGLTAVMDTSLAMYEKNFKEIKGELKAIHDDVKGKGTLSKAADAAKDALHLGKSEEA